MKPLFSQAVLHGVEGAAFPQGQQQALFDMIPGFPIIVPADFVSSLDARQLRKYSGDAAVPLC